MRNCVILGSGRSGSSMVAGCITGAGYNHGGRLVRANQANPHGYFESAAVNRINYQLVMSMAPAWRLPLFLSPRRRLREFHESWVSCLRQGSGISLVTGGMEKRLSDQMREAASQEPWCLKDPRFSFTLPSWAPHLGSPAILVTYRHPAQTVESTQEFFEKIHGVVMSPRRILLSWKTVYGNILSWFSGSEPGIRRMQSPWLFLDYDEVVSGKAFDVIEEVLKCSCDRSFPDSSLGRAGTGASADPAAEDLYAQLMKLSRQGPVETA